MTNIALGFLVIGDWFFTNRENIIFALDCARNKYFLERVLR